MKKLMFAFGAAATIAAASPASAQWMPIRERQADLYNRIETGVRDGSLTQREAMNLRMRFRNLVSLEMRYRGNGLSPWERRDLQRRYDYLSQAVYRHKHNMRHY